MVKIKTGIPGFDKLVKGGLNKGQVVLITGSPGTGKSIFGMQYLYNGATKYKQKGLYVSFEEKEDSIINQSKQFGWDIKKLIKSGKIEIITVSPDEINENVMKDILNMAKKGKFQRIVFDSLTTLSINTPTTFTRVSELNPFVIEKFIYKFISELKKLDKTVLLIAQTDGETLSKDGISEYITDGIIYIRYESIGGEFSRTLTVRKMRETAHDEDLHPLEIGKTGIKIHTLK